ncbi:MAG: tRNA uridine-5-carboxymethylaminomethyl(34) synthesis GTPase MnmE, partial [Rhodothermales bacterium]
HRQHLRAALSAVQSARSALDSGASGDSLALDLRQALHELGSITGEITNEDVLDQIFSRFCIGK